MTNLTDTEKKDCLFQYRHDATLGGYVMVKNTKLITFAEAKELWNKYTPSFANQHSQDGHPEMAIWVNCKDDTDYREDKYHVNKHTKVSGGQLYEVIEKRIHP